MRLRIRFAKTGKVRWTSHRDVARMWERALRRVRLPVAYTAGFSPRPRVSFGLALPTGHESVAEYLDVEVAEDRSPDGPDVLRQPSLPAALSEALPDGVDVLAAAALEGRVPSLQEDVTSCSWEVEILGVGTPP
ncbi:MAG TPA: TIGR03936 family radical SAM-associated protein, partial [Acidimicrobiales bacterium]|nr:TIGR03936 family radical SAM-associated protein [Acidimicrobiales bacterium]